MNIAKATKSSLKKHLRKIILFCVLIIVPLVAIASYELYFTLKDIDSSVPTEEVGFISRQVNGIKEKDFFGIIPKTRDVECCTRPGHESISYYGDQYVYVLHKGYLYRVYAKFNTPIVERPSKNHWFGKRQILAIIVSNDYVNGKPVPKAIGYSLNPNDQFIKLMSPIPAEYITPELATHF